MAPKITEEMEGLLGYLLDMIADENSDIRKRVYVFLFGIVQVNKDAIIENSTKVLKKLSLALDDPDHDARRSLCYVFFEYVSHDECPGEYLQAMFPFLTELMPKFISMTLMSDVDLLNTNMTSTYNIKEFDATVISQGQKQQNLIGGDDEEEKGESGQMYTTRKICCQIILNVVDFFRARAFPSMAEIIEKMLLSDNLMEVEAAVTVLGIVCRQAEEIFEGKLESILPKLFTCCQQENVYLVASSLWTCNKFIQNMIKDKENSRKWLSQYLEVIFNCLKSTNDIILDSAGTSFAKFTKNAQVFIAENSEQIVPIFSQILKQHQPSIFVFDAITAMFMYMKDEQKLKFCMEAFVEDIREKLFEYKFFESPSIYIVIIGNPTINNLLFRDTDIDVGKMQHFGCPLR